MKTFFFNFFISSHNNLRFSFVLNSKLTSSELPFLPRLCLSPTGLILWIILPLLFVRDIGLTNCQPDNIQFQCIIYGRH